jgi:AmmeMemoRadiSam system protein A
MAGPLDSSERTSLLQLARLSITHAAHAEPLPGLPREEYPAALQAIGCAFVTLTRGGALRGCIGGLEPRLPLVEDVWQHAYAAAREDPRFAPITPQDLGEIRIEVSRLTPAHPLQAAPERIAAALRPGRDGVILRRGLQRGTFLPQVWEKVPDPELFLDMLSDKAGIPRMAWRQGDVEILIYEVESFEEEASASAP